MDEYDLPYDSQLNRIEGLVLEIFDWLRTVMPANYDFKEAYKRIDKILDGD